MGPICTLHFILMHLQFKMQQQITNHLFCMFLGVQFNTSMNIGFLTKLYIFFVQFGTNYSLGNLNVCQVSTFWFQFRGLVLFWTSGGNRVIQKVRKTQHQNPEFGHTQNPAKKYISIQGGMKLRKPSILVVNWVSSCLSSFLSASTAATYIFHRS
jgi:hypothetical protein